MVILEGVWFISCTGFSWGWWTAVDAKRLEKSPSSFPLLLPLTLHVSKCCWWGNWDLTEENPGVTLLESDVTSAALPKQQIPSIVPVPHTPPYSQIGCVTISNDHHLSIGGAVLALQTQHRDLDVVSVCTCRNKADVFVINDFVV